MKLLFCYDGPLRKDNLGNFYGIALNNELMSRYNCLADKINIAIRVREIDNSLASKMSKLDNKIYNVIEVPNLSSSIGIIFNQRKAKSILKEEIENSDIVIIRLPSFIGNMAVNICNKLGKKYLIELVSCPWDTLWYHSIKGKIIAPYVYWKTRENIKHAKLVSYVSKEFLQRRYPTNGENIGCSDVDIDVGEETYLLERIKRYAHYSEKNEIVLGTVGAIDVKYKGQKYVIKAISNLKKQGYIFNYLLIGSGSFKYLYDYARKMNVIEQIKFIGPVPHKDIVDYMKKIDIYIQPSNAESHGRVIIEAMSTACPCIGSSTGGIPELVSKKYIFKKRNARDLEDKIKNMISDLVTQSKYSFNKSLEFNRETLNKRRNEFYQKLLN